jgi:hypothetical protein
MTRPLSDHELREAGIDPSLWNAWGPCPFCGARILGGYRVDARTPTLKHAAIPDPLALGAPLAGCERWVEVAQVPFVGGREIARLLSSAGFRWSWRSTAPHPNFS